MVFSFKGDVENLLEGIHILKHDLKFKVMESGFVIEACKIEEGDIELIYGDNKVSIKYIHPIHFYRMLGIFIEHVRKGQILNIKETPYFITNGAMFDMSRNAVMNVDSIKRILRSMSLMGMNMLMLYTEDTYTIPSKKYFGYMRGRYTYDEIKECDDYAYNLGIEIVPCIQTLGHMQQYLRWGEADGLRDTEDILLADNDETYILLDEMIHAACAPLRSKRIHIGMDEAHGVGEGEYLKRNGRINKFDILNSHLQKVVEITDKYGLKPMIWSDMYFKVGSKNGEYLDLDSVISDNVKNGIPENVQLVYWDYYTDDTDFYRAIMKKHQDLGRELVFAGGMWTWSGMVPIYLKSIFTSNLALKACKDQGVKEVIVTLWGDNGTETDYFTGLGGLQLYAEHGYSYDVEVDKLRERFETCTGGNYDEFVSLSEMQMIPGTKKENFIRNGGTVPNPAKYILYQDIMFGLFDKDIEGLGLKEYYGKLTDKYSDIAYNGGQWEYIFEYAEALSAVLSLKSEAGIEMKNAYDDGNNEILLKYQESILPVLYASVENLRRIHRDLWMKNYKPFGFEHLDSRYSTVLGRIDTAIYRLDGYLTGKIPSLPEFEAERLHFKPNGYHWYGDIVSCGDFRRIFSASV